MKRGSMELCSLKRETERNSLVDGQLGTDPFSPQHGCHPGLSQYNTSHYGAPYWPLTTWCPRGARIDDKL